MKAYKAVGLLYLAISLILISCATVPEFHVPRPWIRSLDSAEKPQIGAKLKLEVTGTTLPLLGNEQLTAENIREKLSYLLRRRGFIVRDDSPDYIVQLYYKTDRNDKLRFSSTIASYNTASFAIATGSGAGATSGLGVSIARAVGAIATRSSTIGQQSAEQFPSYTHTIAIEIHNLDDNIVWKGEAAWDSYELNIINRILPAIQLILSDLPLDRTYRPEIAEVKKSHVKNYYYLECKGNWFTCPALPYGISFEEETAKKGMITGTVLSEPDLSSIKDPNAFAAYLDLIQTAEFTLPSGSDDWKDPLEESLWEKVTLGAQYLIGPNRKLTNVLIKLSGRREGYYIDKCWVANDEEYAHFEQRMQEWQQVLVDYYDVFTH